MRNKGNQPTSDKLLEDLDFGSDMEKPTKKISHTKIAEIDPNRCYSPYYTPKPKLGSKGGTLGRGSVAADERKLQFSVTCTPAQKERFSEAAKKDKRKLPDFICMAVEEYIENHGL